MLAPRSLPYLACIVGGLVVGLAFGDEALPSIGTTLGDPLANILLGISGGFCAAIACEVVGEVLAMLVRPPPRPNR
jgi:hypothetical protein